MLLWAKFYVTLERWKEMSQMATLAPGGWEPHGRGPRLQSQGPGPARFGLSPELGAWRSASAHYSPVVATCCPHEAATGTASHGGRGPEGWQRKEGEGGSRSPVCSPFLRASPSFTSSIGALPLHSIACLVCCFLSTHRTALNSYHCSETSTSWAELPLQEASEPSGMMLQPLEGQLASGYHLQIP